MGLGPLGLDDHHHDPNDDHDHDHNPGAWDEDRSGSIDKKEFFRAVRAMGFDVQQTDSDAVFDSLDDDKSGKLEYKELNTMLRKGVGSEGTKANLKRAPSQKDAQFRAQPSSKGLPFDGTSACFRCIRSM